MSKVAHFKWKCRRCGEVFGNTESSVDTAARIMTDLVVFGKDTGQGIRVHLLESHLCKGGWCRSGRPDRV